MNYSNLITHVQFLCVLTLTLIGQAFSEETSLRTISIGTPAIMKQVPVNSPDKYMSQPSGFIQTPAPFLKAPYQQPDRVQVIGDTITFEEFGSGTIITDQYLNYGVVFSGLAPNQDPQIYDYGPQSITRILHSYDWYAAVVVRFVSPLNPEVYRPVRRISFDNSASGDYITVRIYNSQDSMIYSLASYNQERIEINLADFQAAYMVLDDSLETAYAFDNLYFDYQPDENMITFSDYVQNTLITNQYTDHGVLFSGLTEGQDPVVAEYSAETFGRVLRSYDWYGQIVARFVDPQNPQKPRLVQQIAFDNPSETELDYINVKVYDPEENLIYNYTSKSPERVRIDLGEALAAYMVLDDSAQTAYVIDNLAVDTTNSFVSGISDNLAAYYLPAVIELSQNYPNPFNPGTTINYKLSAVNDIELGIYNTLGQKVAILVSGRQTAGSYSLEWNAAGFSSGIYYYRLSTGNGLVQTKKLILLK